MVCVTRDRLAVNWCAAREKIQNVSRKSIQNESMDNQTEYVIVILTASIQKTVAQIMKKLKDCVTVSFWFFFYLSLSSITKSLRYLRLCFT